MRRREVRGGILEYEAGETVAAEGGIQSKGFERLEAGEDELPRDGDEEGIAAMAGGDAAEEIAEGDRLAGCGGKGLCGGGGKAGEGEDECGEVVFVDRILGIRPIAYEWDHTQ
jgi:hypothetical protein